MTPEQRLASRLISSCNSAAGLFRIDPREILPPDRSAIREALLKGGEADYLLFADGKAIATVEAKPEGYTLVGVEGQSGKYATGLLDIYPRWTDPLPFCYESSGSETRFSNRFDPNDPKSPKIAHREPVPRPDPDGHR
jgi:type I site-specific restriction endonuclease